MKKILFYLAFLSLPLGMNAQQLESPKTTLPSATVAFRFGYFSFEQVFHAMPGYAIAKHNMEELRAKYDAEMKRAEDEFNLKYEEFLEGQRNFAPSISLKRQAELRELMEKNMAFKAESNRLLQQAEEEAYAPLKDKIKAAVRKIGQDKGLAFVVNTDHETLPFINEANGEDITSLIKDNLK